LKFFTRLTPALLCCLLTISCASQAVKSAGGRSVSPSVVADSSDMAMESHPAATDSCAAAIDTPIVSVAEAPATIDSVPVPDSVESGVAADTAALDSTLVAAAAADTALVADSSAQPAETEIPAAALSDTTAQPTNPLALRYNGIYLNSGAIARDDLMEKYIARAKQYGIGGFVMDMKDDRGYLSWRSEHPVAKKIGSGTGRLSDPSALVKRLHDNGLVACARVVTFKDPKLSEYIENGAYPFAVLDSSTGFPWKQNNGETWANMKDESVHEYIVSIIAELVAFGFDQIQLDYIRFPSDGPTELCYYPVAIDSLNKAEIIGLLLSKVRSVIDTADVSLAADVFGWVPWLKADRSYWIGQDYDEIARWTDVICPMLYSSHFPDEFKQDYGHLRAYNIILEGTRKAAARGGKRNTGAQPYIQSFNYKSPYYGEDYLVQQMQAAIDGGGVGWLAWNARSDYSMLWKALEKIASDSQSEPENE
jgi:hypothetical protein